MYANSERDIDSLSNINRLHSNDITMSFEFKMITAEGVKNQKAT